MVTPRRLSKRTKKASSQIGGRVVKKETVNRKKKTNIKVKKEGKTAVKKESEIKVKVESKIEESVRPRTIASLSAADDGGPFPNFARPHEAECRKVTDFLIGLHGDPQRDWETAEEAQHLVHGSDMGEFEKVTVLDSLVSTILSQNTTDKTSHKAFSSLKKSFPTWESVRTGDPAAVAQSIKVGGLSEIKTKRIQNILQSVWQERKACSLEHLRNMSDIEIKEYLSGFKGVGPKTISCVLMFCLERPEFPVDVHVWKIAISLGWVPPSASREQTYEHLNRRVPDDVKYDLHVLLVEHGKVYKNDVKLLRPFVKR